MEVNRWEAREIIRRKYPDVAARLDKVAPLGPAPPACTCQDEDKLEVRTLGSHEPVMRLCAGLCRG